MKSKVKDIDGEPHMKEIDGKIYIEVPSWTSNPHKEIDGKKYFKAPWQDTLNEITFFILFPHFESHYLGRR